MLFLKLYCAIAQKQYPTEYFDAPLKIPIIFAGTFGELRSNHFHSGIDIKTQKKEGIPIYAPADGYVYRIKVKQFGYGKALYIKHPNGYTTLYAHLKKFNPVIQDYVKQKQYQKEQYGVDEYFKDDKFPVTKGEIIGYTGDTGSSGGPHLHYEIRESESQNVINPMLFGITTKDTKPPTINQLMVFPLNEISRVNNSSKKQLIRIKKINDSIYKTNKITAYGDIGFGIEAFDQQNLADNKNGIYSLSMKVNGTEIYNHDLETFSFGESKYINLLIDYKHLIKHKKRIQKTHRVENNSLSIYKNLIDDGILNIEPELNYTVEIKAKDFHGNQTKLTIPVQGVKSNILFAAKDTTNYKITRSKFSKFEKENVTIAFPKKTVYKDTFINFDVKNDTAFIHTPTIPLDRKYTLTFYTDHLTPKEKEKVYIANVTKPKYPRFVYSKKKNNKIYTTTKQLGTYTLMFDNTYPSIKLINFRNKKWISKNKTLKVKIKDSLSGIKDYTATIDGEWILMERNHKTNILTYDFSDKALSGSKHLFKIMVSDNAGNTTTKSVIFYKKAIN